MEKGLRPLAQQAGTPGNFVSDLSWVNGSGQAIAALGIGALAVVGEVPEAAGWTRLAEAKALEWFQRHIHAGGLLMEQIGYGGWMADIFAVFAAAGERLTGTFIFPEAGIVTTRSSWDASASLVAIRSGPKLPHGHLDFGSFMVSHAGGRRHRGGMAPALRRRRRVGAG